MVQVLGPYLGFSGGQERRVRRDDRGASETSTSEREKSLKRKDVVSGRSNSRCVDRCIVAFRGRICLEIAIRASRLDICLEYQMRNILPLFN
jgi:hypothetical protein